VPFQFDINMSSPSARPYEHASAKPRISVEGIDMLVDAHQLLDLSLPSPTPPAA
jgi:hypothetical protein